MAASASITGAVILYSHFRKKVILLYAIALLVPTLLMFHRVSELYCSIMICNHLHFMKYVLSIIEKSAYLLGILSGPLFLHRLLGLQSGKIKRILFFIFTGFFTLSTIIEIITLNNDISQLIKTFVSMPVLFGVYLYCLVVAAINLKSIGGKLLKKVVTTCFVIAIIIFPFALYQYFTQKPLITGYMERPILFLILFVFTLVFSFKYFREPAYYNDKGLTEHFITQFSITTRESEIILQVLQGLSNQSIADKLFISPRTVESHLYSIFQKLGVKNRIQLVNLIQTNS
jgi:DNA-binding CsgD family transcriptional regulator